MTTPEVTAARGVAPGARIGLAGVLLALVVIGAMHLVGPSSRVDPVRRTISEYALLPGGWVFDVAVVGLAVGSAGVIAALVAAGLARARSLPVVLLGAWCVGLLLVVAFEKTNWSIGPSVSGYIHRYASLVAFIALPLGSLLLARRHRHDAAARPFRIGARVGSWLALASFVPIVGAIALRGITGVPWWRAVPLGLLERGLALAEVVVVALLGAWALAHARRSAPALEDEPEEQAAA
ncbi:DUF998 domain-containing protein [Actinomycetospora lutea]|uniref:DUF998 domain-containing protein n=1 Tax=Actinomycetospora lutea TaxID=663604 RepID=UPI0023656190|nr:DUF998 domain-containing protein [Actinomycetospora lutea]MDD7937338.1 DUF998 domain-containing protein [Actinomycetospora lutea]